MENRIKEQLIREGISQTELAERLGITKIAVSQMVNSTMPRVDTFQRIADAINVPIWKLMLSDDEMENIKHDTSHNTFVNSFCCPVCGARLKAVVYKE